MRIFLDNVGKKFVYQWVFKSVSVEINPQYPLAVTGPNGSGKSTLLRILSGWMSPSQGNISYRYKDQSIDHGSLYQHVDFVAPYIQLIENFTLKEFLEFHFKFKAIEDSLSVPELIGLLYMENNTDKYIRHFSSGMQQRLRLGLGFYSKAPILLLDEPTSNLDKKAKEWYMKEIENVLKKKTIIIASNQAEEYSVTSQELSLENYRKVE